VRRNTQRAVQRTTACRAAVIQIHRNAAPLLALHPAPARVARACACRLRIRRMGGKGCQCHCE
jgi:hypothetical protein